MEALRNASPDDGGSAPRHWLAELASERDLAPAGSLSLRPGDDLEACWSAVARASGITQEELAEHVASRFGLEVATLAAADPRAVRLVSDQLMRRHLVLPLRETEQELIVAVADPTPPALEDDLAFSADRQPVFEIAPPGAIAEAIRSLAPPPELVTLEVGDDAQDAVKLLE